MDRLKLYCDAMIIKNDGFVFGRNRIYFHVEFYRKVQGRVTVDNCILAELKLFALHNFQTVQALVYKILGILEVAKKQNKFEEH